ncbi:MAG: hypothetical protein JXK94_02590 [Deltaproteobacteria bacterium]|nr:hypothetical protein [Deltaproteobacteria bacterium]
MRRLGDTEGRCFWTGQLLSLVATVVAVYLAATLGYDKAVQYDQLIKDQNSCFQHLGEVSAQFRDETSPGIGKELVRLRIKLEENGLAVEG